MTAEPTEDSHGAEGTNSRSTRHNKKPSVRTTRQIAPPVIDLGELEARGEAGEEFEQLMRAIFETKGLRVSFSGRGPDQGRDLYVEEDLRGEITGRETRRWLVWCRNHSRTRKSVTEKELPNISDKCSQHNTSGFLLVSATSISNGAQTLLDGLRNNPQNRFAVMYYVRLDIERMIFEHQEVFRQFFPESYNRYRRTQAEFTITEPELQQVFKDIYGLHLTPDELRPLLIDTLRFAISDAEQVRDVLLDVGIKHTLETVYRQLLGRGLDPSGHLTWGIILQHYGLLHGRGIVEASIKQLPEYRMKHVVRGS